MTYTPFTRNGAFGALALELTPESDRLDRAQERYEDLGEWLSAHARLFSYDVYVYPQGSAALGATNQHPDTREFDIDLVVSVRVDKDSISKQELNDIVHGWLELYVTNRQPHGGHLAPSSLDRKKRAWTLHYEDDCFHMDILPVVPDLRGELRGSMGEPSWLTDKSLFYWQPTNPKGFREWFYGLVGPERRSLVTASVDVEPPPAFDRVQTELQLAIRLLKRHRDEAFRDDPNGVAPPSVVITALASKAYAAAGASAPRGDIAALMHFLADGMKRQVGYDPNGNLQVPNPTCQEENYADRFRDRPDREQALFTWFQKLSADLKLATESSQVPGGLYRELDRMFGSGLGGRVAKHMGSQVEEVRRSGQLTSSGAGAMAVGGAGTRHKKHEFYGDETA